MAKANNNCMINHFTQENTKLYSLKLRRYLLGLRFGVELRLHHVFQARTYMVGATRIYLENRRTTSPPLVVRNFCSNMQTHFE